MSLLHRKQRQRASSMGKTTKETKEKDREKKGTKPKVTGEWWIGDKTETMLSLKKQSLWEK